MFKHKDSLQNYRHSTAKILSVELYGCLALKALRAHLPLWTFSLCIHCKTKSKKKVCRFFKTNFEDFQNLMKIEFCWRLIFEILIPINLLWGYVRSHIKADPDRFSQFWRLLDTNKQTYKWWSYCPVLRTLSKFLLTLHYYMFIVQHCFAFWQRVVFIWGS